MENTNASREIYAILKKYNVDIDIKDLGMILPSMVEDNKILHRYAWLGDKIIDTVIGVYSEELFGETLYNEELHKMSKKYCSNDHFQYLLEKMGMGAFLPTRDPKDKDAFFEAVIYLIYNNKGQEGVKEFIKSINFFQTTQSSTSHIEYSIELKKYIHNEINKIDNNLEGLTENNSIEIFRENFDSFQHTIEHIYRHNSENEFNSYDYKKIIRSVLKSSGCFSNRDISKVISTIVAINDLLIELDEGLNKKETRVNVSISKNTHERYTKKYMIGTLKTILDTME